MSAFRFVAALIAAPSIVFATAAAHAELRPFTTEAFHAAQEAGQPILVDAHAGWCPICARQKPTINAMATDPAFADLVIFKLNYDKQRAEKQELGIRRQSTLIAFAGKTETGRSVGVTNAEKIRALASTALHK